MNRRFVACLAVVLFSLTVIAQQSPNATVPRFLHFGGTLKAADGTPRTGVVGVMWSLYTEQQGGAALWTEVQNVTLDANGHYSVLLGSQHPDGVPADLFTTNEARWLGIQVEAEPEQPRVLLVSVPYALKAGDAETLNGKPLSAFLLNPDAGATGSNAASPSISRSTLSTTAGVQPFSVNTGTSGGTTNFVAKWTDASTLGSSLIYDNGSGIGIGISNPESYLDVEPPTTAGYIKFNNQPWGLRLGSLQAGQQFLGIGVAKTGADNNYIAKTFDVSVVAHAIMEMHYDGSIRFKQQAHQPDGTILNLTDTLAITPAQRVGIGVSDPESLLDVERTTADYVKLNNQPWGFRIGSLQDGRQFIGVGVKKTGADNNYIATSANNSAVSHSIFEMHYDGSFHFKQQAHQADGTILTPNETMTITGGGFVGIGVPAPSQKLSVAGVVESTSGGFKFPDTSVQSVAGVTAVTPTAGITGSIANGVLSLSTDSTVLQERITGVCGSGSAVGAVNANGTVTCNAVSGGGAISPPLVLSSDIAGGGSDASKVSIIYAANSDAGTANPDPITNLPATAIAGFATNTGATGYTVGVVGRSDAPVGLGVIGIATGVGSQSDRATAVGAFATASSGRTKGIDASINSASGTVMSLKGPSGATLLDASIGTTNGGSNGSSLFHLDTSSASFAVNSFSVTGQTGTTSVQINGPTQINGNLSVGGTLSKSSGSFKIDHPLDPANKYLYHSFVESPDMMNVYNGVAVLDAHGQTWVQLPDYFEALNKDFRYQLTAIGAPGPNLYVANEVSGNRFRIAGGKPHAKVSWQVTGIRHDAYANAHRIPNEVEKPSAERGTYIHPELFGHSPSNAQTAPDSHSSAIPVGTER